jgi:lipopolysaccharide transport system ATP-binding protein
MQVRLAFSVATAIRPDILIVDEALSVGDIYFQQKCYERISQFKKQGTTLLFVSHDLIAVNTICDRTIFIKDSYIAFDGKTDKAIDYYHTDFLIKTQAAPGKIKIEENDTLIFQNTDTNTIDSLQNEAVKLINVELFSDGVSTGSVISDSDVTLSIKLLFLKAFDDPHVGFKIRDRLGVVMFETSSYCMRKIIGTANKNEILTTSFKFKLGLICGEYTVTVGVANKGYAESEFREHLIYVHGVKKFTILKNSNAIVWAGIYNLLPEFSCAREPSIINVT